MVQHLYPEREAMFPRNRRKGVCRLFGAIQTRNVSTTSDRASGRPRRRDLQATRLPLRIYNIFWALSSVWTLQIPNSFLWYSVVFEIRLSKNVRIFGLKIILPGLWWSLRQIPNCRFGISKKFWALSSTQTSQIPDSFFRLDIIFEIRLSKNVRKRKYIFSLKHAQYCDTKLDRWDTLLKGT